MKRMRKLFAIFCGILPLSGHAAFIQSPIPPSAEKNFFEDDDGDGTMDRVSVVFLGNLSRNYLDSAVDEFRFVWPDSSGNLRTFAYKGTELSPDSADPAMLVIDLSADGNIQRHSTALSSASGSAKILFKDKSSLPVKMSESIAPVVQSAFFQSAGNSGRDTLRIILSERVSIKDATGDLFEFRHLGVQKPLSGATPFWNADSDAVLLVWKSSGAFPVPQVSIRLLPKVIKDSLGNATSDDAPFVKISGNRFLSFRTNALVEIGKAERDFTGPVFELLFADPADSLPRKSEMGIAIDVGGEDFENTLIELSSKEREIEPGDISLHLSLRIYTESGEYVTSASSETRCTDTRFPGANCLETPRTLFLKWNLKANDRRTVGTGAYIVKPFAAIYYAGTVLWRSDADGKAVQVWGVRRK